LILILILLLYNNCGWYGTIYNYLYSGPPHNFAKNANLSETKNEVIVAMNMEKGTLKFIINNQDKGDSYTNIPLDKPLSPAVMLCHVGDSIEIIKC